MKYDNARFRSTYAICQTGDAVKNAGEAVRKIRDDFKTFPASIIVFFASIAYDADVLAREMQDAFPDAVTMGCTGAGEGVDDVVLNSSVAAMAFSGDVFDYAETALILESPGEGKSGGDIFTSASDAIRHISRNLGTSLFDLDYRKYVGFVLTDRIAPLSERVLERVGEKTNVFFTGGVAGDDYKFIDGQRVFYRGKAYPHAVLLALWKPKNGFELLKTQAVDMTDKSLVITRADEDARIIWEFDGEAAASAYARAIGKPAETMDILDFDECPLALTAEGGPYLRAVVKQVDGKGLQMFAQVREGTSMTVTNAGDILAVTRAAIADKRREMGDFAAILHINCASRHTALTNRGQLGDFAALFSGVPSLSVSSYGEVFVNVIAMTSVMILFK